MVANGISILKELWGNDFPELLESSYKTIEQSLENHAPPVASVATRN